MSKHILLFLIVMSFSHTVCFAKGITCPPMPTAVTDINRDFKTDISAGLLPLGKIKVGDIGLKAEIIANNLFAKYPYVDKLLALQTMSATYCSMLKESELSSNEKLRRWENFQNKVLKLDTPTKITVKNKSKQQTKSTNNASLSINERLALDDNPTIVEPMDVSTPKWLGDKEPFLTVMFKNISKRTALNFHVRLAIRGKFAKLSPTQTADIFKSNDLSIEPAMDLLFPVGPVSEIANALREQEQFQSILVFHLNEKTENCPSNCVSIPITLEYSYKSIFGQEFIKYHIIFAMVAK